MADKTHGIALSPTKPSYPRSRQFNPSRARARRGGSQRTGRPSSTKPPRAFLGRSGSTPATPSHPRRAVRTYRARSARRAARSYAVPRWGEAGRSRHAASGAVEPGEAPRGAPRGRGAGAAPWVVEDRRACRAVEAGARWRASAVVWFVGGRLGSEMAAKSGSRWMRREEGVGR
ncbi:hypothetical protein BDY21DRAFT_362146 [Lineolata rhizophorae]|uniref:Uncharacterized protein n=1 Tax=Lineolata rhizophorae TaxID=578093 RepID=A0A6A6P6D3_9PEZI|nr:hypothetical protein BDY21DRAFT_362146 [Lineolata rhizophorae]